MVKLSVGLRIVAAGCLVSICFWMVPDAADAQVSDLGPFTDDDGHPGEPYLEWLAENGIVHGCNPPANTRICPDRVLNRIEAVKILVGVGRHAGSLPTYPSIAHDYFVDDDQIWGGAASGLANLLARASVISGCDPPVNRHICPSEPLQRGQIAKMLVNTLALNAPDSFRSPWTDTATRFYHRAARIAAYHGLWDSSNSLFGGRTPVTRAEFARVVVTALGLDPCPSDPFTEARAQSLSARFPDQAFAAYAFDTRTGCAYWMNPEERLRTASVFKVMVMAGTLLEARSNGRAVTSWELGQLRPMITRSANEPVRALWGSYGGSPWYARQARIFELTQTTTVGDDGAAWGRTTTSAKDQGDLVRQVILGDWGPLERADREIAWDLMTSVVAEQTWGITRGVPEGWTVGQKNGFAGGVANSVGYVARPGRQGGYVIAVLTNGWSSWERGVRVVDEISSWVADSLAAP
jgi:Beta-lactamase enzyme family/S-layer homology domain